MKTVRSSILSINACHATPTNNIWPGIIVSVSRRMSSRPIRSLNVAGLRPSPTRLPETKRLASCSLSQQRLLIPADHRLSTKAPSIRIYQRYNHVAAHRMRDLLHHLDAATIFDHLATKPFRGDIVAIAGKRSGPAVDSDIPACQTHHRRIVCIEAG